jgi:hypothetical protein
MRVIVRRERPHPGAQLSFTDIDGWRFQAFATDTAAGQLAHLDARHRGHATVEDRIRCGKHTGLGRFPSRLFAINAVWLELAMTACDLIAWTQTILLDGDLARCEPKTLRYRLLHVAARITRGQRRVFVRIAEHWPWRHELARRVRPPRRPPTAVAHLTDPPPDRPPPRTQDKPAPGRPGHHVPTPPAAPSAATSPTNP